MYNENIEDVITQVEEMKKYNNEATSLDVESFLKNRVIMGEILNDDIETIMNHLKNKSFFAKVKTKSTNDSINLSDKLEPLFNKISARDSPYDNLNDMPDRIYLIERLRIEESSFYILCATSGSGKTMFLQYLVCCLASGQPLFGEFPVTKGSVIHLDQEQSFNQTMRRYIRICDKLNIKYKNLDIDRVNITRNLDSCEEIRTVEAELMKQFNGKTLAIIDSLNAVSEADENTDKISDILKIFKRISEKTKCAIILIHHTGHGDKGRPRGHSSIIGVPDGILMLDKDQDSKASEISFYKTRDGDHDLFGLRYQLKDEGNYNFKQKCSEKLAFELLIANVKPKEKNINRIILKTINDSVETLNQSKLYKIISGDRSSFDKALKSLIELKYISTEDLGKGRAINYSITEAGQKHIEEWNDQ